MPPEPYKIGTPVTVTAPDTQKALQGTIESATPSPPGMNVMPLYNIRIDGSKHGYYPKPLLYRHDELHVHEKPECGIGGAG